MSTGIPLESYLGFSAFPLLLTEQLHFGAGSQLLWLSLCSPRGAQGQDRLRGSWRRRSSLARSLHSHLLNPEPACSIHVSQLPSLSKRGLRAPAGGTTSRTLFLLLRELHRQTDAHLGEALVFPVFSQALSLLSSFPVTVFFLFLNQM